MRVILFYALLLSVVVYAFARGGRSERAGAVIALAAALLSHAALSPMGSRFAEVELSVLAVDVAVLLAFVTLALKSERYWPIWIAALQLIGVLAHIAKLADPSMMRTGYAFIMAFWSYPMLALIAIGTWRHHRTTRTTKRF
jgi:hypothetical protein